MKQKKIMVSLVLIMLLVIGGFGYMVYKQDAEKEKMIAIAHSGEAKKVYESFMKKRDKNAFTKDGIIKSYKVDDKSLDYNPMGGMFVNVVINNSSNLYMSFNLVEEDNKLDYANVVVSGVLLDKLGEPK